MTREDTRKLALAMRAHANEVHKQMLEAMGAGDFEKFLEIREERDRLMKEARELAMNFRNAV